MTARRVLLVDPDAASRTTLADRLRRQGYAVSEAADGAEGAISAMASPPDAVIADLWMPSISGVQLCRLLNAEPATSGVPILLRGPDGQRSRFWAERAGAVAYVVKGRMGDLVRGLTRSMSARTGEDFFTTLADGTDDIRDRIAAHLDAALFDSVIAADVRQLATCDSFERLFDRFAQFVSEVTNYRWLAITTHAPARMGLHTRESLREIGLAEARAALSLSPHAQLVHVEDDDAAALHEGPPPLVRRIYFGELAVGELAMAPCSDNIDDERLVSVLARELGGALRVATLVEETQRLASVDALTGLRNRRAFVDLARHEVTRTKRFGEPLSVLLLDVDHFKRINDTRGHASGDLALSAVGACLATTLRAVDLPARWGGEEFVAALPATPGPGAMLAAERVRSAIEGLRVRDAQGSELNFTVSIGVAIHQTNDTLEALVDRADRAMYAAKSGGRNRVCRAEEEHESTRAPRRGSTPPAARSANGA